MASKPGVTNWYYQAKDWKCFETIIMVEGPSTPLMLHIAAIKYVVDGLDLDYDGVKDQYPFVTLPWPDRRLFDLSWPSIRKDIKEGDAKVVAARKNGCKGGRPKKVPKRDKAEGGWIDAITTLLEQYDGLMNRRVTKDEMDEVTLFFNKHKDPQSVIKKYKQYLDQKTSKGSMPVGFTKWLKTLSKIEIKQEEYEYGEPIRITDFDDDDL